MPRPPVDDATSNEFLAALPTLCDEMKQGGPSSAATSTPVRRFRPPRFRRRPGYGSHSGVAKD